MAEFANHVTLHFRHESLASPEKGMRRTLKSFLRDLAARFDDLDSIDRIATVQSKLDALQVTMSKNIALADERQTLLQREVESSDRLAKSARDMFRTSQSIKRHAQCACIKGYCVLITVILLVIVIGVVVIGLGLGVFHWFSF